MQPENTVAEISNVSKEHLGDALANPGIAANDLKQLCSCW